MFLQISMITLRPPHCDIYILKSFSGRRHCCWPCFSLKSPVLTTGTEMFGNNDTDVGYCVSVLDSACVNHVTFCQKKTDNAPDSPIPQSEWALLASYACRYIEIDRFSLALNVLSLKQRQQITVNGDLAVYTSCCVVKVSILSSYLTTCKIYFLHSAIRVLQYCESFFYFIFYLTIA